MPTPHAPPEPLAVAPPTPPKARPRATPVPHAVAPPPTPKARPRPQAAQIQAAGKVRPHAIRGTVGGVIASDAAVKATIDVLSCGIDGAMGASGGRKRRQRPTSSE